MSTTTTSTKPRRPSSGTKHLKPPPAPANDEHFELGENGDGAVDAIAAVGVEDPPPAAAQEPSDSKSSASAPRAPVAVGRSLEITCAADVCMELLIDKFKLLDYEREFCRKKKPFRKPLSRAYFAAPVNAHSSSEQYYYFASLAAWLLTLAGVDTAAPKSEDDPNTTCSTLITHAGKLGFGRPSYHPPKLTAGQGKEVCGFLEGLVDYVLERKRFAYKMPVYKADAVAEDTEAENEDDTAGMEGADEMAEPPAEEAEEEAYMEAGRDGTSGGAGAGEQKDAAERQVLVSKVDPAMWKLELERVAPRLRITINADSKDWRNHLDEAHQHQKSIMTAWPDSKAALERLRGDVGGSLEKLMSREKFLNDQFDNLMQQYKSTRMQLGTVQGTYNKRTESVADRNSELSRITEQNDEIKHFLDERGSNIADATPVVRIKGAIKKLGEELNEMAVRIGVVSNTLLQLSLKNKRRMQSQAALLSDDDDDD